MTRDEQLRIAHLYCNGKKTLQQCAELLDMDIERMMDVLYKLDIPLDGGRPPFNKPAMKLLRQRRTQVSS